MKKLLLAAAMLVHSFAFADIEPEVDPANITTSTPICLGGSYMLYRVGITDFDLDAPDITAVVSSNNVVMSDALITYYEQTVVGATTYFEFYGEPGATGTFSLDITFTDGTYSVTETLPTITVIDAMSVDFIGSEIALCSEQGLVNLYDHVTIPGGVFTINSTETDYPDGVFNTFDSGLNLEQSYTINYSVMEGYCHLQAEGSIIIHESQQLAVDVTPTSCGESNGTAVWDDLAVTVEYDLAQWSSGQQNINTVTGLAAGAYSLTVTFDNGCISSKYFSIETAGADATAVVEDADCHGAETGSIDLTPVGLIAPVSALWSTGHSTIDLTGVPAGIYTVHLHDANDCAVVKTFTVSQPEAIFVDAGIESSPSCGGADGEIEVWDTWGGEAPYTYEWSNGDVGTVADEIAFGIHSLTTTDANGCMTVNTFYVSESNGPDLYGMVTPASCGNASGAIQTTIYPPFGETISSISWSNGAISQDVSGLTAAFYTCTLVASNTCRAIKGWNVPSGKPMRNDICVVTVDSATTTNLVVWQKVETTGISHYNIYRETSAQGNYALIDTVNATSLSVFNDVVASPMERSWRYKISAVNECGVEGPLSIAHQTIHLEMMPGATGTDVDITWNPYEGAAFSNYHIYRFTTASGEWEEIAVVPVTQLAYTDNTIPATPGLDYMVEMELDDTCTAVIWRAQDFNSSRSNKDKAQFNAGNGTGDSHNSITESYLDAIRVYPNPATDRIIIEQETAQPLLIEIRSVDGQVVQSTEMIQLFKEIRINDLSDGIYFVSIRLNGVEQTKRFIKN